jgi:hypothetical protein
VGGGCQWHDAGDRNQPPARFQIDGDAQDQLVGFLDLSLQVLHLQLQLRYAGRSA